MKSTVSGFTLTELLVVIGIIGVLTAVLLPVFFAARQKAHQTTCAANLKQIALATFAYTQDYDSAFPYDAPDLSHPDSRTEGCPFWEPPLQPYVKSRGVFACPVCQTPAQLSQPARVAGYAFNMLVAEGFTKHAVDIVALQTVVSDTDVPGRESELVFPASTILFAEVHFGQSGTAVWQQETTVVPDVAEPNQAGPGWDILGQAGAVRHGGGSLYAFADGHVKWYRPEQITTIFETKSRGGPTFLP